MGTHYYEVGKCSDAMAHKVILVDPDAPWVCTYYDSDAIRSHSGYTFLKYVSNSIQ